MLIAFVNGVAGALMLVLLVIVAEDQWRPCFICIGALHHCLAHTMHMVSLLEDTKPDRTAKLGTLQDIDRPISSLPSNPV